MLSIFFGLQAIMKACVASGSDPSNPEKFLGYMVPNPDEVDRMMIFVLVLDICVLNAT